MTNPEKPALFPIADGRLVLSIPVAMLELHADRIRNIYKKSIDELFELKLSGYDIASIIISGDNNPQGKCLSKEAIEDLLMVEISKWMHRDTFIQTSLAIPVTNTSGTSSYRTQEACQVTNYAPTMNLRIAVPEGTHFPNEQALEQEWRCTMDDGSWRSSWRPIPKVIIKREPNAPEPERNYPG